MLAPEPGAPQEFCASVVPAIGTEGERVLDALRALATKLRAKRAYTNTATFDLKCEVGGFFLLLVFCSESCLVDEWTFVGPRCAGRGLRARRRRVRTRLRRGMPSLANTNFLYSDNVLYPVP